MSLTEISIKRPSLIIVLFTVLIGAGLFAYKQLSLELLPEISQPTLVITTPYPGASPTAVEQTVSKKIEDVMSGIDGLKSVKAQSIESNSVIIAEFKTGVNIDDKQQESQRKINNIISTFPSDVKTPNITKVSPSDLPIMQLMATSNLTNSEFYDIIKNDVKPQIQQVEGVGEVTILGGQEREIQVRANQDKLNFYKLSILNLTQAIKQANIEFPAGKIKSEDKGQMTVRLTGKFSSIDQINELVVQANGNSVVKVKDIASVADVTKTPASIFRYNGVNGIGLMIKKQSDANAVKISKQVKEKIDQTQKKLAASNVKIVITDDSADFTILAVDGVIHDLGLAVILVAMIMWLFLHSLRDSLIVLVAIPTSLITTFMAIYLFGYSLNLMTLLALSLVVGILVDDSIVVLENIHRHLLMGKDKRTAAIEGRAEIGFSAIAITTVDIVVFGPLALINNSISAILRPYALTIVVATLTSLLVCFTLTPWLASRFGKVSHLDSKKIFDRPLIWFEKLISALSSSYLKMLSFCLKHKIISLSVVILMFFSIGQIMKMGIIGNEFVTNSDKGQFRFQLEYDKNTTVLQNNIKSKAIEDYLRLQPDVLSVFNNVAGASTTAMVAGVGSDYKSEMTVTLIDKSERKKTTEKLMLEKALEVGKKFPGVKVEPQMVNLVNGGQPIQIILSSENFELLMLTANDLKTRISKMPGTINTKLSVEEGNPEIEVNIDREKMAQLGLNIAIVGQTIQNAYAGNTDAKYTQGTNEYDISVKYDDFDKRNINDVQNIAFTNTQGKQIKLLQFANIVQGSGPSLLERQNRRTSVTILSDILGITSGVVADNINKSLIAKPLPANVDFRWSGDIERQADSFGALGLAILAAIILMYLVMVALYDNFIYPFVVLFSIPVSFIGVFLALALSKSSMSIFAMLGMIMLMGLVAKNAILIVDFANHRKEHGDSTWQALLEAGKERLRPILMTTLAMVIGMLPIALSTTAGSEWKNALAWVIIGGLTSSLFLTVFVVPIIYYSVDRLAEKFGKIKSAKKREYVLKKIKQRKGNK